VNQTITYVIDGRGRRVGKSINGTRVRGWLYADQLRPVAELDGDDNVIARFVYGTKPNVPEYIIKNGTTYRVFSDHLGSPRVIVDASTGAVVQRMDFHTFGELIQDSNPGWQPFGFAGGVYDPDSVLVRFGARDYDPFAGRWAAKDPTRFRGGDSNLYRYAATDPVNWRDASGRFITPGMVTGGVVGAISGFAGSALAGGKLADNLKAALWGGAFGAAVGYLDPTGGVATSASLIKTMGLGAASGFYGNLIGQVQAGRSLMCLDLAPAVVSAAGGALGGAFGAAAVAGAEMMAGTLGPWATGALEAVGGSMTMVAQTVSNVMSNGGRR
jgi:RHS repeat-associated protein